MNARGPDRSKYHIRMTARSALFALATLALLAPQAAASPASRRSRECTMRLVGVVAPRQQVSFVAFHDATGSTASHEARLDGDLQIDTNANQGYSVELSIPSGAWPTGTVACAVRSRDVRVAFVDGRATLAHVAPGDGLGLERNLRLSIRPNSARIDAELSSPTLIVIVTSN
ncbi:MAG TPA: hypothetical protein VMW73_01020 [Spirochaetia bacterium]|nr:hypothetical protein [Spirochaetia bacterium]